MLESQQQYQNMINSQSSQLSQNQASYTPFLEHPIEEKSESEKSIEALRESERQFQNILDS